MADERLLRPSFHLQRARPTVAQQVHYNVDHLQHHAVIGSQRDAVVELRVLGDGSFSLPLLLLLPPQNLFHLEDLLGRGMRGGPRRQRRFQHLAKIQKLADRLLASLQRIGQRIDHCARRDIANDRPRALAWFNQTRKFQAPNRIANRTPAYPKRISQLAFRGQLVARFQLLQNQAFDLPGNFLVDLIPADNFEVGFDARRQKRAPSGLMSDPAEGVYPVLKEQIELFAARVMLQFDSHPEPVPKINAPALPFLPRGTPCQ